VLQRRKVLCDGLVRDVGQALRRPARRLVLIDQRSADPLEKVRRLPHEALASAELGAQAFRQRPAPCLDEKPERHLA